MRLNHIAVALAVAACLSASVLRAGELVIVNFEGKVTGFIDDFSVFPGVSVGDTVTGSYSYDTNATDLDPNADGGSYDTGTIALQVGALSFSSSPTPQFIVENAGDDLLQGLSDVVDLDCGINATTDLRLVFFDTDGTALSSDALPGGAPVLSEYEVVLGVIGCDLGPDFSQISFSILTVSQKVVPTVSEWGIASLGLLLLVGLTIKFRGALPKRA